MSLNFCDGTPACMPAWLANSLHWLSTSSLIGGGAIAVMSHAHSPMGPWASALVPTQDVEQGWCKMSPLASIPWSLCSRALQAALGKTLRPGDVLLTLSPCGYLPNNLLSATTPAESVPSSACLILPHITPIAMATLSPPPCMFNPTTGPLTRYACPPDTGNQSTSLH